MPEQGFTSLHSCRAGGFKLDETVYAPGLTMDMHGHGPAFISAVMTGGFKERVALGTTEAEPLSWVIRPADSEHAVSFGNRPTKIFHVEIGRKTFDALSSGGITTTSIRHRVDGEARWTFAKLYAEFSKKEAACPLVLEELVLRLLCDRPTCPRRSGPTAKAAKDYLEGHFQGSISLQDAAAALQTHPVYLARTFRESFGITVGEYLRRLRLRHASDLIAKTDLPLGEVAIDAGFADQAHLTKAFRQVAGTTPARYRRNYRLD